MASTPTPPDANKPPSTQARLGTTLLKSLISLREEKGRIRIEDVGAMLENMASTLQKDTPPDSFLRKEFEQIAQYIAEAKQEVAAMVPAPEAETPKNISKATMELGEVVKATEAATNTIMDAADVIQLIASEIKDPALVARLNAETTKIYDACNFQDITGQRISKVIKALEHVELRVVNLVSLFGGALPEGYTPPQGAAKRERPDEKLMHGPQLTADAPSQDEIDKLFASLK